MINCCGFRKNLKLPYAVRMMRRIFHKRFHLIPDIRKYDKAIFDGFMDCNDDVIPNVYSGWDNTPRAGKKGLVLYGFSPEEFKSALDAAISKIQHKPFEKRFLTIKSWNEWAEGNYVEPDMRWGRRLLEAIKTAVNL